MFNSLVTVRGAALQKTRDAQVFQLVAVRTEAGSNAGLTVAFIAFRASPVPQGHQSYVIALLTRSCRQFDAR